MGRTVKMIGDWRWVNNFAAVAPGLADEVFNGMRAGLGREVKRITKEVIQKGAWARNSTATAHLKGSSKPLIDTGRMMRTVRTRSNRDSVFIGWDSGTEVFKAAIAQTGQVLTVTDKMRAYLRGRGIYLKQTTKYLRTPSRPFLTEVEKRAGREVDRIVEETMDGTGVL